jgi:hypothetical protein
VKVSPDGFVGRLIITWPKPTGPVVAPHGIVLTDAETGEHITSTLDADIVIHADPQQVVTATLTMLTDADGKPLAANAKPVLDTDGENVRTGVFRWLVAEMRVAA